MNFNKVIIAGHSTKDVETAFTQSGTEYAKCGIAVNNGFGENKKVCFIDFTCWGKTAKFLAKHFSKGISIIVEGELQLDTWEKDGKKNWKHTLNVQSVGFAGGDKKYQADSAEADPVSKKISESAKADLQNEDIPF